MILLSACYDQGQKLKDWYAKRLECSIMRRLSSAVEV